VHPLYFCSLLFLKDDPQADCIDFKALARAQRAGRGDALIDTEVTIGGDISNQRFLLRKFHSIGRIRTAKEGDNVTLAGPPADLAHSLTYDLAGNPACGREDGWALFILEPTEISRPLVGKRVEHSAYPDGSLEIQQVNQAAIAENKHLHAALALVKAMQEMLLPRKPNNNEPRRRSQRPHMFAVPDQGSAPAPVKCKLPCRS
jgi:hypothetical protein